MLQIAPDAEIENEVDEKTDEAIYCARCGEVVTRTGWRLSMDGHEHVVFNPLGRVFRILCFIEAPGAAAGGEASDDFSWFKGYLWRLAFCGDCGAHLGWRYEGDGDPPSFFGLIKNRLSIRPPR